MVKPIVTVILTSYNKPETVGRAIESVLDQTFHNWELFIMDDASNDETVNKIKSYLGDPRINYFNSKIRNEERYKTTRYATLINEAIALSSGKYLTYLTDDNFFYPRRLSTLANYLDTHSHIDIVYTKQKVEIVDSNGKVLSDYIRNTRGVLSHPQNIVDHCSIMHRRSLLKKIYGKFNSYWDDHPSNWHNADAAFWSRLTEFQPFHPIDEVLDIAIKGPTSFQSLNAFLPEKIPSGTLVKGLAPTVYLIEDQKRRVVTNKVFKLLKYNQQKVVSIPDPVLFKYEEGQPIDSSIFTIPEYFPSYRLLKGDSQPHIYFIENHKKRHILNLRAFRKYHFNKHEIIKVNQSFLESFPDGDPITTEINERFPLPGGVVFKCGSQKYISENNILYPVHPKVLDKLHLRAQKFAILNQQECRLYKKGKALEWKLKKWR
ncbi:glycosyltransferase [Halalkalibacter urbisdiaboli]|uniref:glycosyltransferase n=1 Tax=Halalkalibacter urbisdiaboli TaxID=1960589 RepID=UPI000B4479DC|nr:glycosyltransferase [Halalkalibacter urbisdiaboli]